jgi:hypothetical protein
MPSERKKKKGEFVRLKVKNMQKGERLRQIGTVGEE